MRSLDSTSWSGVRLKAMAGIEILAKAVGILFSPKKKREKNYKSKKF